MTNSPQKQPTTFRFQIIALTGYLGLLIFMPLWLFYLDPRTEHSAGFMFIIYILPLLLPLKGIIQDNPFTYAWANFIVMIYFIHGLTLLWVAIDIWVIIELFLASCMFIGCSYYAKFRGRELGLKIRKLKQDLADEKSAHQD